jgi:hypothetical protein
MSFRQFILDSTGRATLTTQAIADSPGASSIAGQAYMTSGEAAFATTDAVAASDAFIGGFRYSATGILRISDTTAGLPASTSINQGIAMTDDGQACITTEDNTSPAEDYHLAGVALTDDSRIYVNLLSFMLPLDDLGAGEVDLVLKLGQGDPTFTRATTATTVLSTGLIAAVASGTARSWYDPTTLVYGGYLAEGARTNLCLQSEDLATTWTTADVTVGTDTATSPDGAATADTTTEGTGAATQHRLVQAINLTATTVYTLSVWVKRGVGTRQAQLGLTGTAAFARVYFNLDTVTVANQVAGTGTIKAYQNNWFRITVTGTSDLTGANSIFLAMANGTTTGSETYTGDGVSQLIWWGAQLEAASFASSYIPTTTAAVVRNADVLTYDFAGNADAAAGTCYAELGTEWATVGALSIAIRFSSAGFVLFVTTSDVATSIQISDNTDNATKQSLTSMLTAVRKRASSWGAAGIVATGDGATVATATFDGSMDATQTEIQIGGDPVNALNWFGTLRNVRIWTSQLPDGELQVITT